MRPSLRPLSVLALCAGLAALTACDEGGFRITTTRSSDSDSKGVLKVVDALQCPDTLGALTRKGSAQSDGKVCTYTGPRGAEVSLHLVTLGDQPTDAVLRGFENQLLADMPKAAARVNTDAARAEADAARADADAARADADAERASVSAPGMNIDAQGDRASVSLPGIRINADGDKADVRIGGFHISADDSRAKVSSSGGADASAKGSGQEAVSIQARDDSTQVRTRAPGEATRQTFLLTSNRTDDAWRLVGYEARGPRGGPIVVATVRARERNSNGVFDDAKDLVTLNVGE